MKLIVQIPALNEEATIAQTIRAIPRRLAGISQVEVLVIDDGCTDQTAAIARAAGADHVLSMSCNVGLARAFSAGIEEAIARGADIIVNTDADNQYCADDIRKLVQPILDRKAQIVIGSRPIAEIKTFSPTKRILQKLGSWVVRKASGTDVPDAPSGFRAYTRDAAARLFVVNTYTYTLETIIQAGRKRIPMAFVPVRVNRVTRPSRLFKGTAEYVCRSAAIIIRMTVMYAPLRAFAAVAGILATAGLAGMIRFLGVVSADAGPAEMPTSSLVLFAAAGLFAALGLIGDLIAANRAVLEDIRAREMLRTQRAKETPRLAQGRIRLIDAA